MSDQVVKPADRPDMSEDLAVTDFKNPLPWLARRISQTRFEDLPPDAVQKAKTFLIDTFGVGVAGSAGFGWTASSRSQAAGARGTRRRSGLAARDCPPAPRLS